MHRQIGQTAALAQFVEIVSSMKVSDKNRPRLDTSAAASAAAISNDVGCCCSGICDLLRVRLSCLKGLQASFVFTVCLAILVLQVGVMFYDPAFLIGILL